tara:strand:+ start:1172 stop:1663 length:492 start_codon:yes stop_codon:yes gene_type:complete
MATLSLTTHFTVDIDDDDSHTITGGSTTATDSITITHYFDRRYSVADTTLTEIWNDTMLADFDFLWIESDQAGEIQLVCNEGGTLSGSNIENGFCVKLIAGVPFILGADDSRNMGDMAATFNESNHQSEIDTWETNWAADTIDRIEWYHSTGSTANVRIFAAT